MRFLAEALLILKEAPEISMVGKTHPLFTERWRGRRGERKEEQSTQMGGEWKSIFCVLFLFFLRKKRNTVEGSG